MGLNIGLRKKLPNHVASNQASVYSWECMTHRVARGRSPYGLVTHKPCACGVPLQDAHNPRESRPGLKACRENPWGTAQQ